MAQSQLDILLANHVRLAQAATDADHAIAKGEFDAAIDAIEVLLHAPMSADDSSTIIFTLDGQEIAAAVRVKSDSLQAGQGEVQVTDDGLVVKLGTGANDAAAGNHSHASATQSEAGYLSAEDKAKLDGVEDGATRLLLAGSGDDDTAARSDHSHAAVTESAAGFMTPEMLVRLNSAAGISEAIDEIARDAVSGMLADTSSIDATYTDDGSGVGELRLDVRRKTSSLQAGEGVIDETEDGLVVRLGTSAYTAAPGDHTHNDATQSASGFMSSSDKAKLDLLSANQHWRESVPTYNDLPLNVDPIGTVRLVREEAKLYRCIANVGFVGDQWSALVTAPWSASAPATASATGSAGQMAYDADWLYVCVAANTWKRAAISTWT